MKGRSKGTRKSVFFIVAILIVALAYTAFFGVRSYHGDTENITFKGASDIRWGIDISGGVEAIFKPDITSGTVTNNNMDAAKEIIETRLLNKGITESEVCVDYENKQVIVRFPWQSGETDFNPTAAVAELGETAELRFCEGETTDKVILTGSDVESASAGYTEEEGYVVQLKLNSSGQAKFAEATARLVGSTISIWMDETEISAPTVNQAITGGNAIISGNFDSDSANELASKINAGALPFSLTVDNTKLQIISPTLGANALHVMTIAGIVAFIIICILMISLFRLPGLVTCIALLGQIAGTLACCSGFFKDGTGVTLTIPGIAGIILSIGMGVDCNVISGERIKEEFKKGRTIDGAIENGFKNSFSAVLDGNVTVFIVSAIMMGAFGTTDTLMGKIFSPVMSLFGSSVTGSVYSFGYTLIIGVIFNLIMGVFCSRLMLKSVSRFKFLRNPWLYGGTKE